MNEGHVIHALVGALSDPFDSCHMGVTVENVASRWKILSEEQDQMAVESYQRAQRATDEGYFKVQILPISIKQRKQMISFEKDEHIWSDASTESWGSVLNCFYSTIWQFVNSNKSKGDQHENLCRSNHRKLPKNYGRIQTDGDCL